MSLSFLTFLSLYILSPLPPSFPLFLPSVLSFSLLPSLPSLPYFELIQLLVISIPRSLVSSWAGGKTFPVGKVTGLFEYLCLSFPIVILSFSFIHSSIHPFSQVFKTGCVASTWWHIMHSAVHRQFRNE